MRAISAASPAQSHCYGDAHILRIMAFRHLAHTDSEPYPRRRLWWAICSSVQKRRRSTNDAQMHENQFGSDRFRRFRSIHATYSSSRFIIAKRILESPSPGVESVAHGEKPRLRALHLPRRSSRFAITCSPERPISSRQLKQIEAAGPPRGTPLSSAESRQAPAFHRGGNSSISVSDRL